MRSTAMRACLPVLLLLLLGAGCASVPLSTMWRLRNFGPEQLAAIDPSSLRVAVLIEPEGLLLDVEKTRLALRLVPHQGEEQRFEWTLRTAAAAMPGLVPDGEPGWQILRLTPEAEQAVAALRPVLDAGEDAYAGGEFNVSFGMADPERVVRHEALFLSVRLSLAANQAPFTLLDRARVPVVVEEKP